MATTSANSAPSAADCSAAEAASCRTDRIVPGIGSPIDVTTRVTACRSDAARRAPLMSANVPRSSAAAAATSAIPLRIWDRITPELPRAPRSAPSASAAATCATSSTVARVSACAQAARMVNSMFVPVSASATGKTLSRLISSVCLIRSATALCAQLRRAGASSRRAAIAPPHPCATVGVRLSSRADTFVDCKVTAVDTGALPVLAIFAAAGILIRLSGHPWQVRGQDPAPTY